MLASCFPFIVEICVMVIANLWFVQPSVCIVQSIYRRGRVAGREEETRGVGEVDRGEGTGRHKKESKIMRVCS